MRSPARRSLAGDPTVCSIRRASAASSGHDYTQARITMQGERFGPNARAGDAQAGAMVRTMSGLANGPVTMTSAAASNGLGPVFRIRKP